MGKFVLCTSSKLFRNSVQLQHNARGKSSSYRLALQGQGHEHIIYIYHLPSIISISNIILLLIQPNLKLNHTSTFLFVHVDGPLFMYFSISAFIFKPVISLKVGWLTASLQSNRLSSKSTSGLRSLIWGPVESIQRAKNYSLDPQRNIYHY